MGRPKAAADMARLGRAAITVAATVLVCCRFAERIVAALGERGTNVLVRLSAFILLCVGIEIHLERRQRARRHG
jgi:multiple antibiotic resistance protein